MFDTNKYNSETKVIWKETVIKQSITPDKVVDMYNNIKREISWTYLNKWNSFELVILQFDKRVECLWEELFISYRLNWNQNDMTLIMKNGIEKDKAEIIKDIIKDISNKLAEMLISEILKRNIF